MKQSAPPAGDVAKVRAAFASLGQGLRAEEIAAATALPEARVRKVLAWQPEPPALASYYDRGAEGWYHDPFVSPRERSFDAVCRPGARAPR